MQLIVPAFNEEARLPHTLAVLRAFLLSAQESAGPLEVIVVDNGSTDATARLARAAELHRDAGPGHQLRTKGKGAAVRAGMAHSTADVVGFMDADCATDLSALAEGVRLLSAGADVAVASRAVEGSVTTERHSRVRALGATLYRRCTRQIAPGIADTQCGFKVFRGDLAREVFAETRSDGFSFDVEVLGRAQRRGARDRRVPGRLGRRPRLDVPAVLARRVGVLGAGRDRASAAEHARGGPGTARRGRARAARAAARCRGVTAETTDLRGIRVGVVNWRDPWHTLAGGSERYAWEFARAMVEAGAQVEFWTARDEHQVAHEVRDGITSAGGAGLTASTPRCGCGSWSPGCGAASRRGRRPENGIPVFAPLVVGRRTRVLLVMHHVHQEQFRTYFPRPVSDVGRFLEGG